jgi:hypothetical protein
VREKSIAGLALDFLLLFDQAKSKQPIKTAQTHKAGSSTKQKRSKIYLTP